MRRKDLRLTPYWAPADGAAELGCLFRQQRRQGPEFLYLSALMYSSKRAVMIVDVDHVASGEELAIPPKMGL